MGQYEIVIEEHYENGEPVEIPDEAEYCRIDNVGRHKVRLTMLIPVELAHA